MQITLAIGNSDQFGLTVGEAGFMMSTAVDSVDGIFRRLDEFGDPAEFDRISILGKPCVATIAIGAWADAAGVPVDFVDTNSVARNFCGSVDATAGAVVAEAEARGFDVTDAEAQAIAVFDFVLGGPDVTRAGNFQ